MSDQKRGIVPFVAPVRPRNLLWIAMLGGMWVALEVYGTPHLRVQYTWSGKTDRPYYHVCNYWGLSSFRVHPPNGECPLFVFARTGRKG